MHNAPPHPAQVAIGRGHGALGDSAAKGATWLQAAGFLRSSPSTLPFRICFFVGGATTR
jgi:hypothetical protein